MREGHDHRLGRAAFWRGARDALSLPAWVLGFSVLGIGSLVRDAGFPAGAAALSTVVMWAGPAQAIFFASVAAGVSYPVIALAVTLSSIRLLPMTVAILPLLRRPGQGLLTQLAAAHFIAVTMWVEGLRRLPPLPPPERVPYFFGFALACLVVCTTTTYIGYFLLGALPVPLAAGLLFLTPIFFTVSLVAGATSLADWAAMLLGAALAPAFHILLSKDVDLLAAGLVGGTAAYAIGKAGAARR
ncbi:MAG TPA: AzlC family ABC transporter permease [Beijerinckiaceae bacterium]|nr:AzlC family ABC transporter permease [Beijerinckiaceae bacterium]